MLTMHIIVGIITCIVAATMFVLHCESEFGEAGMGDYAMASFVGLVVGLIWPLVIPFVLVAIVTKAIVKNIKKPKQREGMSR